MSPLKPKAGLNGGLRGLGCRTKPGDGGGGADRSVRPHTSCGDPAKLGYTGLQEMLLVFFPAATDNVVPWIPQLLRLCGVRVRTLSSFCCWEFRFSSTTLTAEIFRSRRRR